ncbi:MAG: hypothetical protein ACU84Q_19950, partial [Gammaproteobacteria bacterium]
LASKPCRIHDIVNKSGEMTSEAAQIAPISESLSQFAGSSRWPRDIPPFLLQAGVSALVFVKSLTYLKTLLYIGIYLSYAIRKSDKPEIRERPLITRVLKILEWNGPVNHDYTATRHFSSEHLSDKQGWARSCLTVMTDLVPLRKYRQQIAHYRCRSCAGNSMLDHWTNFN